ncbi:hypothetical protein PoB_007349300 [Plakobranchus ocellatus]|uniref:Uncharacterized protein n=1 Tax=Plakobranchus ocellatus TaxID=259542 RepID=A0AAV4DSC6_9GAST|nr:hypothetical protein PoB_007349300 [Plakobranchus ocellatus]
MLCSRDAIGRPHRMPMRAFNFHASVWAKCSKTQFHCKAKVELAVISAAAAAAYNFGSASVNQLGRFIQRPVWSTLCEECRLPRKNMSQQEFTKKKKNRQQKRKRRKPKKKAIEKAQREEGAANAPGMF